MGWAPKSVWIGGTLALDIKAYRKIEFRERVRSRDINKYCIWWLEDIVGYCDG